MPSGSRSSRHGCRRCSTLYWQLGRDILGRQVREGWGAGVIDQVSANLRAAFPEIKGFSRSNLKYIRAFAEAWPDLEIGQPPVGQFPEHPGKLSFYLRAVDAQTKAPDDAPTIGLLL